jgi:hypothetical protein
MNALRAELQKCGLRGDGHDAIMASGSVAGAGEVGAEWTNAQLWCNIKNSSDNTTLDREQA